MVKIFGKTPKNNQTSSVLMRLSCDQRLVSRSLPYRMLPEQPLKLSVLKLDGSFFSFHVGRNATVAKLKLAMEEEFKLSLSDEGNSLWPLVWSHFCLCYQNQKLINDRACIQSYGIRDGDQLHFIQHMRIDNAPIQKLFKYQMVGSKQRSMVFASEPKGNDRVSIENQSSKLKHFLRDAKSTLAHRLIQLLPLSNSQVGKEKHGEEGFFHEDFTFDHLVNGCRNYHASRICVGSI